MLVDGGATSDLGSDAGRDAGPSWVVGGARPTRVIAPLDADGTPRPLIVLLHGHGASGVVEDAYLGFSRYTRYNGIYLLAPDGILDADGMRAWNATDACCGNTGVDDVAYLRGLVAETASRFPIDATRIYFAGHSNGGFMSYRMACDATLEIAAIASLAGATWLDESQCMAMGNMSVLEIHGTADTSVIYDGTPYYPGARQSVERWATRAGCDLAMTAIGAPLDLDSTLAGTETDVRTWQTGCAAGIDDALWTMNGAGHIPPIQSDFAEHVITWLLTHHR